MASILHVVPKFVGPGPSEYQASFWISVDPNPGPTDIVEVSANLTDWLQDMYDNIIPYVETIITAAEYVVYIHDLLTGEDSFYFDGGWTFAGTTSADMVTPQVAATVSAPAFLGDRPAQKRMIPTVETYANSGILDASYITALGLFGTQWITVRPPSATFTYTPGVVRQGPPRTFAAFTGTALVRDTYGTVRSRKRGLGI